MKLSQEAFILICSCLEQAMEFANEGDRKEIQKALEELEAIGTQ